MLQVWGSCWGAGCLFPLGRVGKLLKGWVCDIVITLPKEKPMHGELASRLGLLGS